MRIWDLPPAVLCRQHLLGEHRELHGLWNILTQGKAGYGRHPETQRWVGRLAALYLRHEALVTEMRSRGYRHRSPLDQLLATGLEVQDQKIDSLIGQYEMLCGKPCPCPLVRWIADGKTDFSPASA